MSKWPKGLARQLNLAMRARLLPVFEQSGFAENPKGGRGQFEGSSYDTDLFRSNGTDIDIVSMWIGADGFHSLAVYMEAVRATDYDGDPSKIPTVSHFPIDVIYRLMPERWWSKLPFPTFKLGPPWPKDRDAAIDSLANSMQRRLPILIDYLERGETTWWFRTRVTPRWSVHKPWYQKY